MSKSQTVAGNTFHGKFVLPEGSYEGEYTVNAEGAKQRHGFGTQIDASGQYKGQWVNDTRTGNGSFLSTSGCRYEGSFTGDNFNGIGTYTWPDGASYAGTWVRGTMHGPGAYTDPAGTVWSGRFSNGLFAAEGKVPVALRA